MSIPDVTYVVLNYNPHNQTEHIQPRYEKTLEYLYRNSDPSINKQVIVIDQGCHPEITARSEELRKQYGFEHYILGRNVGISAGINLGFRMGRGRHIALLTYDVLLTKGCDTVCLRKLDTDPLAYHVVPLSNKSDQGPHMFRPQEPFGADVVTVPGGVRQAIATELTVNYFSQECIRKVGFFDEKWKGCYENMDYMLRILLAGGKTIVELGAFAWHYHNTAATYIGKIQFYKDYMEGDIFANGELNKLWKVKWGTAFDDLDWSYSSRIPIMTDRAQKFSMNVYLGWPQDRGYL